MPYGLNDNELEKINSVFKKFPDVEKAILYGSRAKRNYRKGSDIDLVLIGKNISMTMLLQIENELDELLLPYKIDLSVNHKIENKDLLEHINRIGIVVYKND